MEKITRAELARRKRINLYKKIILYGFCVLAITPIITSIFLLYKINKMEERLDYVLSEDGGDYLTYRSSHDALLGNPNAYGKLLSPSTRTVLGNTQPSTNVAENTLEDAAKGTANTEEATEVAGSGITAFGEGAGLPENTDGNSLAEDGADVDASEEAGIETAGKAKKNAKRVYLTFDDGPSIYTGQILDILKANDVKATFFVIGKDENYYDYYRRIVDEGHTLGMHSYTHQYQKLYASEESFAAEIEELQSLLADVTGVESHVFRFPGGSSNDVSQLPIENYIAYLNEHNINYYDWNALSGDAVNASLSPEQLVNNIMKDVRENKDSIVLMHDLQNVHATVESLQMLIDTLKSEGYEILPIDENAPLIQHVSCNSVEE